MSHGAKTLYLGMIITLLVLLTATAFAQEPPLRSGTIEGVEFEGLYTFITVKDADGSKFFVVTEVCKAEPDSTIEVIRSDHFDKMNIPPLGGKVEDVYLAKLIKIDGREIIAATQEGLVPQGCQILR